MTFWMVFAIAGFGFFSFMGGIAVMYLVHKAVPHKVVQMPTRQRQPGMPGSPPRPGEQYAEAGEVAPRSYTGDGVVKESAISEDQMETLEQNFDTTTRKAARETAKF